MGDEPALPVTLARAASAAGEVALRRRGHEPDAVYELIVNGAFAMDSAEVSSELALADLALADLALESSPRAVLVGGLGLGFTANRLAWTAEHVDVVELAEPLIDWARSGLTPSLAAAWENPRLSLHSGDIAAWLVGPGEQYDAICLDVDNGPDFLIRPENRDLYSSGMLQAAVRRLRPGGRVLTWCQGYSPEIQRRASELVHDDQAARASVERIEVERDGRAFEYAVHIIETLPS